MNKSSLIGILMAFALAPQAWTAEFFVAPNGNDAQAGTKDRPFATIERARDAARQAKGSIVVLAAGTYRLTKTFTLDDRDSGTTYTGKDARISGGVAIPNSAVKPVTDPVVLERLLPEVRGRVLEVDLRALGVSNFGSIGPRGFARPYVPAPLEVFVDDEPLTLAQWPKPGQPGVPIGKVLDKGSITRKGEKPDRGGTFEFKTDRPARWSHATDVWITGLFANGYADNTVQVKAFDLEKNTITTVQPHLYGFQSGAGWNRWTALNLLEEISLPGEYMADKSSGKLYFLPPKGKDITKARLEVSVLQVPLVAIEGATAVVFNGISFECSRGMGVYIERGSNNRIQNCTLRNLGMVAVCIGKGISPDPAYSIQFTGQLVSRELGSLYQHLYDNPAVNRDAGRGHGVIGCDIYNIGAGAIALGGGDRKTLAAAGNFVENCNIHDFNRWDRTYKGAVNIDGVGNRISHCSIHDAPGVAILAHGNEHVIEYNEIYRVMQSGDDNGVYYTGRDPTERGTVIRYNYIHDSATANSTFCLYFDDSGGDDTKVYGNIFRNTGNAGTVFMAGGSDFRVTNNIFVDCRRPLYPEGYRGGAGGLFKKRMEAVNYTQPPWSTRYPEFVDYLTAKLPRNNVYGNNLIAKSTDPRFVDGAHGNFALKPGADTGFLGFQPIPFDKIGLEK